MNTSSRKNPSTLEAFTHGPRFPAGLCPLLFSFYFNVDAFIKPHCQQISFGRNQVKLCGPVRWQDIANICRKVGKCVRSGATVCSPGFFADIFVFKRCSRKLCCLPDLQHIRPVRQRSLSADLIFWYFFIKEKGLSLRGYERTMI